MAAPTPGLPIPPTSGGRGPESGPRHALPRRRRWVLGRTLIAVVALGAVGYGSFALTGQAPIAPVPSAAPHPGPVPPGFTPTVAPPPTGLPMPSGSVPPPTLARPPSSAARSTPGPASPATATPAPGPGPGPKLDTSLATNTLYAVTVDAGTGVCSAKVRRPKPPVPDKQLVGYLDTLVDCLQRALTPPLRNAGITLPRPTVMGYRQQISTPCGWLSPTSAPAYYCSGNGTIYVPYSGDDGDEAYTYARLGYLALVAHEYGHHLQYVSGMFGEYTNRYYRADLEDRYALSRRLELQADCFAGVFLGYVAASIELTDRDRAQLREWHEFTGDEDVTSNRSPDHGSAAAQIRWLDRGLDRTDYGRCNTWKAPANAVK
ncbi:MAG: neutral zinc metallopeptidase [Propionibacteriaceae bacterium]